MAAKKRAPVPSKMCLRCGKVLQLADFYLNKNWTMQNGHDAWCKQCSNDFCTTKEKLKEYCWYNNRAFSEELWRKAQAKAMLVISTNPEYLSSKTNKKRKAEIEERATCKQFFAIMNFGGMYVYSENIGPDGIMRPYREGDTAGILTQETAEQFMEDSEEELVYSDVWNGYYTKREIDYLDKYFDDLQNDFVLDNRNLVDYARKVAKASLDVDIIQDKRRRGQASMDELNRAQTMFDKYCQSAAFAACKRQAGQTSGIGTLGEIIVKIESEGLLQTPQVVFPPDDVDKIIADFRHTIEAVGAGM